MKVMNLITVAVFAAASSGCATILRGTKQDFTVETTPAGAQANLSTGETCAATPCTFRRPRKEGFTVTVSMAGYQTSMHEIRHHWSRRGTTTGIVGNAILGGGIGIGFDAASGANQDLTPNPLAVTLTPVPPAPAPVAAAAPLADAQATPAAATTP